MGSAGHEEMWELPSQSSRGPKAGPLQFLNAVTCSPNMGFPLGIANLQPTGQASAPSWLLKTMERLLSRWFPEHVLFQPYGML